MNTDRKGTTLHVSSEIGVLRKLLIHSPDSGLGQVVPSKAQDWLFEDILHLRTVREHEYDDYLRVLFYFLEPDRREELANLPPDRAFFKPEHPDFHRSEHVIEIQSLLSDLLERNDLRKELTAAVCALEGCNYQLKEKLESLQPKELSKAILSGFLPPSEGSLDGLIERQSSRKETMIFSPVPNLIFTRDLAIVINDHILLNKAAKRARSRESLLIRYIVYNHPLFSAYRDRILEIPDPEQQFLRPDDEHHELRSTLEGGDVMVVSPDHVLIGCSERTSIHGVNETVKLLFARNIVSKITVIKIPNKRDYMHIDTLFTQVRKNTWVLLKNLGASTGTEKDIAHFFLPPKAAELQISQFRKGQEQKPRSFENLEMLLKQISREDLGCDGEVTFIYSGNGEFPYDAREQWTDSCNLLALREGVVLGYNRNDRTIEAFREKGFTIYPVRDLLQQFEDGTLTPDELGDTFISMPSSELSRARGGFHCMSLPILRNPL